jgi:hypothetical protein
MNDRDWNDDDRALTFVRYSDALPNKEEEVVPIWRILKEMYDEDKEAMYTQTNTCFDVVPHRNESYEDLTYVDTDSTYWKSDDEVSECEDDASECQENEDVLENMVYKKFCYY